MQFKKYIEQISLLDLAQERLKKTDRSEPLTDRIYKSGWDGGGEWTCPLCGRMLGKNLKGESPFKLAKDHARTCTHIPQKMIRRKFPEI